jgi:hypothetical protein
VARTSGMKVVDTDNASRSSKSAPDGACAALVATLEAEAVGAAAELKERENALTLFIARFCVVGARVSFQQTWLPGERERTRRRSACRRLSFLHGSFFFHAPWRSRVSLDAGKDEGATGTSRPGRVTVAACSFGLFFFAWWFLRLFSQTR